MDVSRTAVADRRTPRRTLPAVPAWWADVAGVAAVLSLLVVTALWTADHGVQELLGGVATGLTSLGRLAGLVSADLMLVQVVLMARVPLVERRFGQDRIARWHRLTGRPAEAVRSVTVVGPELLWADVYATAAVARGADALDWLATLDGYAALLVDAAGGIRATPNWPGSRPAAQTRAA
ncbi:hypothetical protein AB0F68_11555 [Micromonospora sp. NPDC023966]|uniref:FAD:protein FMN transferase n=1 Tax=Micromonospora sp. NPDC023966 TaxID=3154699 RepID=UPI003404F72F